MSEPVKLACDIFGDPRQEAARGQSALAKYLMPSPCRFGIPFAFCSHISTQFETADSP